MQINISVWVFGRFLVFFMSRQKYNHFSSLAEIFSDLGVSWMNEMNLQEKMQKKQESTTACAQCFFSVELATFIGSQLHK